MSETKISKLIETFTKAAKVHQDYSLSDKQKANKAARTLDTTFQELSAHGQKAREVLLELIENKDPRISLMAAVYSLKYNPEKSLEALRKLEKQQGFIAFQAEQAIKRWDEGNWHLE